LSAKSERLRIGILGCGPIAQMAHFDACRKSRNAELYAICDTAEDLLSKMAAVHSPRATYLKYEQMLADPQVDAVIIATSDQFHVPLSLQAIQAGKHVLVEKPLGVSIEECETLRAAVKSSGLVLQVGHNRRFDPGIAFAQRFINDELGERMGLKYWYYDSTYRYTMTDNLQPLIVHSESARKPTGRPKENKRRYFLLTHGSHLVDSARFLGGKITSIRARLVERFGAYCWFVALDFADGSLGHLDMTIAVRGDFEEGFQIYGEHGSVTGKVHLPWFHKSSIVECFSTKDRQFHRPLGEDAYTYKLQIESFADVILNGAPMQGADVDDGLASLRALAAIAHSAETGRPAELAAMTGAVQ
jgi:predicted dehydrogenase